MEAGPHTIFDVKTPRLALVTVMGLAGATALADEPLPAGFDPQRHMLVSEVKPGMKGYGLSVFSGTKIERFEVEVLSILHHFNPQQDVILIRTAGANLEHTNAIAGMSGSPIFLKDDAGKERMIGAFAYGWPMVKDPIAGVQPIQYMLSMPMKPGEGAAAADAELPGVSSGGKWSATGAVNQARAQLLSRFNDRPRETLAGQLQAMSVPLAVSGMSQTAISAMAGPLSDIGLTPLQTGGSGGEDQPGKLEPGSVLAVPLLTGDIDMTAVGTCTEVLGDKVFGFGHPFTGTGPIELPMCAGQIQGIVPNLVTSFKLGSASRPLGTLLVDHGSGVGGQLGASPKTAPMTWRIHFADGSVDRDYHFSAVIHPQFTPMLTSAAAFGALSASRQLPHFNTVDYSVELEFTNGKKLAIADRIANAEPMVLFMSLGAPITAVTDNPFSKVLVKSVNGEITVKDGAATAEILHVGSSRQFYKPGETVRFFATLRPFRSVDLVRELSFALPADLAEGSYNITVSDVAKFVNDEQAASPFRFTAANVDEVFAAIGELASMRSDAIYMRLSRTQPGVAMGRTSLPDMPSSQRQMLLEMSRPDVIAYMPSVTRHVASEYVIDGNATLSIQVSKTGKAK